MVPPFLEHGADKEWAEHPIQLPQSSVASHRALHCSQKTPFLGLALPRTDWVVVNKFSVTVLHCPSLNPEVPVALLSDSLKCCRRSVV